MRQSVRLDASMRTITTRRWFLTALAPAFAACTRRGAMRIAVIPKTTAIDYWENLHAAAQDGCERFGFRLFWNAPQSESNYAQQAAMVEDAIRQRFDGIILAPSHGSVLASSVWHAKSEGIPLVLVDSPVMVPPHDYVAYIGSDETRIGSLAAARVGERLGGRGTVAVVGVSPTVEAAVQRERGFAAALNARHPGVKIVDVRYGLSDHIRSRVIVRDMLNSRFAPDAIFASDSFGTRGAFGALHQAGSKVRLVGVAQERDMVQQVRLGLIDALVVRDPYTMGSRAIEILADALRHRPIAQRRIETPVSVATRDNLSQPEIRSMVEWRNVRRSSRQ